MTDPKASIPDPLEAWRLWVDQAERRWNSTFNELMGTEQFSQVSGRMMEAWLAMQSSMNEATQRYFSALNLPTRTDVLSIADRLSSIDRRLDDLERRLDTIGATAPSKSARPKPRRTKKAASSKAAAPKKAARKAPARKKAPGRKKAAAKKSTAKKGGRA